MVFCFVVRVVLITCLSIMYLREIDERDVFLLLRIGALYIGITKYIFL